MNKWPGCPRPCEDTQTNSSPRQIRDPRNHGSRHHGDHLHSRDPGNIRFLLHNPGGVGYLDNKRCLPTLKMEKLKKLVIKQEFDFVGLCEVNKDWRRVQQSKNIWSATENWKSNRRIQTSQNSTKPPKKSDFLVGGTVSLAFDELVPRICEQGEDFRRLGRWSYITIAGKNNIKTTIFTCYCPCFGKSPGSTYSQHLIYLAEHKSTNFTSTCPRQLFGMDLKNVIEEKISEGHQLIVKGDFNSNYDDLTSWMVEAGLIDVHESKFGKGPNTYIRSKGSAIDRVFASPHLNVPKCGYLSFSKLMSDHRGVWFEIPKILLFGFNPPECQTYSARRLKTEDPRVVKKYLDHLYSQMLQSNLFNRMENIYRASVYPLPNDVAEEYEQIDEEVCNMMTKAERLCRRLRTGTIKWSPQYQHACLSLEYWLKRRSYIKNNNNNVRQLIILQKKLGIQYDDTLPLQTVNNKIKLAHAYKKECKQNDESMNLEYRSQLAIAKENNGEGSAATYIRTRNAIENKRRLFRNIKFIEGKTIGGFTTKVDVTQNNTIVEYTDRNNIEAAIIKANESKYHQTEGSSQFLNKEFTDSLGLHGEGLDTSKVTKGTYIPPAATSEETRDFLLACKSSITTVQPDIISRFTAQKNSWKIRKEKTCTYNQHIGHFKSIFKDRRLSWFFFQRADIPEISGYSPRRHRTCIDLMIMKKKACYDVNKQRTIGILDTEFNQSNKRTGKDAMNLAIENKIIANEQFAVKNVAPIHQIISRRCFVDHHHSKRRCFSITSSDLAGCYDRIVHTAAALALLRAGIPHTKIKSMFSTIQRMTHKIRTAFGDSSISYGGDDIGSWENYPQGVLQGNAAGPTIWVLVSSIIFDILHKRGLSVEFCTSLSKQVFKLVGFAYVDDCDLIQSGTNPIHVLESMQQLINNWSSLMEVTGGVISVDKSWFYLIDYVWARGKWVAKDVESDLDLVATSPDGHQISLKRLHSSESSNMLGVWFTPNGNNSKLIKELKLTALQWGAKIRLGNPSPSEAWYALTCTISPKLKYPLPACTLSQKDCQSIMYPAIKAALPKSKICSTIPTPVRDCPQQYGGLGLSSLYHYQGTSRISILSEQIYQKSTTGMMLLQNIEDMALEIGLYGLIWNHPFEFISKYVARHSYIYHILQYNHENNISLSIPHTTLEPNRQRDESIMSIASQFFSNCSDLRSIQKVRMTLEIVHLSDITTADGSRLDQKYLTPKLCKSHKNCYDWPQKHQVNSKDISMWRKLLGYVSPLEAKSLSMALGNWNNMSKHNWTKTWDFFTDVNREFLYQNNGNSRWSRFLLIPNSRRSFFKQPLHLSEPPTSDLIRASTKTFPDRFMLISTSLSQPHEPLSTPQTLHFGSLCLIPPKIDWFMKHIIFSPSTSSLLQHLIQGTALGVSDGSFYPEHNVGACSWILATPDGSEYVSGGGIIPGDPLEQNAYRSELGGQLGLAAFISAIQFPIIINPSITIACDGKAALDKVNIAKKAIHCKDKQADFLSIISDLWLNSCFTINKTHVYGHQDDTGRRLTRLEILNCQMDARAKQIARLHILSNTPNITFSPTSLGFGSIKIAKVTISSKIQQSLYSTITKNNYITWLSTKSTHPINLQQNNIYWPSISKARKEASLPMKIFITKWISGFTSSGSHMVKLKLRQHAKCPGCPHQNEDLQHILTCPHPDTTSLRQSLLKEMEDWFLSSKTHPLISSFILQGLSQWFQNPTCNWIPQLP